MQAARRAYARALHAAPQRGAHWGDLAAALQLEAQLRRAHSRMAPEQAPRLRSLAERMLRGAPRFLAGAHTFKVAAMVVDEFMTGRCMVDPAVGTSSRSCWDLLGV